MSRTRWAKRLTIIAALFVSMVGPAAAARHPAGRPAGPYADHVLALDMSPPGPGDYGDPPAELKPGDLPNRWTQTELPHLWRFDPHTAPATATLHTWYRLNLNRPTSAEPLYLYIPRWQTVGKIAIYADNRLIYAPRSGPFWNSFNLPVWAMLAPSGGTAPKEVLIQITSQAGWGGALSTIWVGDKSALSLRYGTRVILQNWIPVFSIELLIILGLFCLIVWIRERKATKYLLMFIITLIESAVCLQYQVGVDPLPISEDLAHRLALIGEVWAPALAFLLASEYLDVKTHMSRLFIGGFAVAVTLMECYIFVRPLSFIIFDTYIWLVILLFFVYSKILIWSAYAKKPNFVALVYCCATSLSLPCTFIDILMARRMISIEWIYLTPYTVVAQVLLFIFLISYAHASALNQALKAKVDLVRRLADREHELAATYTRLRQTEQQQVLFAERQRLMRDMHDGVGATLMGALAAMKRGGLDEATTTELLQECIDDLKLTIDSLEPVDTNLVLLLATVRYRLQSRFKQAGLVIFWSVEELPPLPSLSPDHALHVLRMIQEIFTNILKHARASQVHVVVAPAGTDLSILIEDNGVGFDLDLALAKAAGGGRRGLKNLTARAHALGGEITWRTGATGTAVELRLPIATDTVSLRPKAGFVVKDNSASFQTVRR